MGLQEHPSLQRRSRCTSPQNWRTVLPSVTTGGLPLVLTFSLTHSAARREDSSVPVLSWQIVTARPPSPPLRNAAKRTKQSTPPIRLLISSSLCPRRSNSSDAPWPE